MCTRTPDHFHNLHSGCPLIFFTKERKSRVLGQFLEISRVCLFKIYTIQRVQLKSDTGHLLPVSLYAPDRLLMTLPGLRFETKYRLFIDVSDVRVDKQFYFSVKLQNCVERWKRKTRGGFELSIFRTFTLARAREEENTKRISRAVNTYRDDRTIVSKSSAVRSVILVRRLAINIFTIRDDIVKCIRYEVRFLRFSYDRSWVRSLDSYRAAPLLSLFR